VGKAQSANAVTLAIHLNAKGIGDGVSADSFEPGKFASHSANVNSRLVFSVGFDDGAWHGSNSSLIVSRYFQDFIKGIKRLSIPFVKF
jgi:hypothetical protein